MLANVDNSFAIVSHRWRNGALAQLGERLLCKHQVIGSIPIGSTIFPGMKKPDPRFAAVEASSLVFDIVNGF